MGDFNSQPYTLPIALLRFYGGLRDSFLETHPQANDGPLAGLRPEAALESGGITCDSPLNSYSAGKPIPERILAQGGKRLDYIFYRGPEDSKTPVRCVRSEVVLTELVPGRTYSYSDHFGLASTFAIGEHTPQQTESSASTATGSRSRAGQSSDPLLDTDHASLSEGGSAYELDRTQSSGAATGAIRAAHDTLIEYAAIAGRRNHREVLIAVLFLIATVGLTVGSAWQPKSWIQPIFTVVAFAFGVAGATYYYAGWLWGRWERGLLDEVIEEMATRLRVLGSS